MDTPSQPKPLAPDNPVLYALRWFLGLEGVPFLSRPTFRYEFFAVIAASLAAGALTNVIFQLFLLDILHGPKYLVPIIASVIAGANLFSTVISQFLQRRRAIPYLSASCYGAAGCAMLIALLPPTRGSVMPLTVIYILIGWLLATVINIRTVVRHSNYPNAVRGSVVGRLIPTGLLVAAISAQLSGILLDTFPSWGHHLLYTCAAAALASAGYFYSRIRIRQEPRRLRYTNRKPMKLLGGLHVLRDDRSFRFYMINQFLIGGGNMMIFAVLLLLAVRDVFNINFKEAAGSFVLLPAGIAIFIGPMMGMVFDRMKILRVRIISSFLWTLGRGIQFVGLLMGSWTVLLIGFAATGLAQGGATIIWNIGHTRFAPPEKTQDYMGVHLTLAGIRGFVFPVLAYWLYDVLGYAWGFRIAISLSIIGTIGFVLMKDPKEQTGDH